MWYRSYRDHVIMAFPSFDTATSLWAAQASIAWVDGHARKSEFVRFAKRVMTEADAVALALNASYAWIDKRLTMVDKALPQDQARSVAGARLMRAVKPSKSAPRIFTYAQFKSLMEKSGLGASEQSLEKSYMALTQLRKRNHSSWSQIVFKMKHSQDSTTAPYPKVLKMKPARLPLTLRDWRRVI